MAVYNDSHFPQAFIRPDLVSTGSSYVEVRQAEDIIGETQHTKNEVGVIEGTLVDRARIVVADEYERMGYVQSAQRTEEGFINEAIDPHVKDSIYYASLLDSEILATARLIRKENLDDYPALKEFGIPSERISQISDDPSNYREVSALVKHSGFGHTEDVLKVYADMFKDTINAGSQYWLMSTDARLTGRLFKLFGKRSFEVLGDSQFVLGSDTDPLLMDLHKAIHLLDKPYMPRKVKAVFEEGLKGINPDMVDRDTQEVLARHGIIGNEYRSVRNPIKKEFWAGDRKYWTDKRVKVAANIALGGYALGRAGVIPATNLDNAGVNPWVFLGLDVGTVPTYVEGLARMTKEDSWTRRKIGGAALAGASFVAPYAYAGVAAQDYSAFPSAAAIFIGLGYGAKKIERFAKSKSVSETFPTFTKIARFLGGGARLLGDNAVRAVVNAKDMPELRRDYSVEEQK